MADDENKSDVVIENFYLISEILFHLVSSSIVRAAWLNKNGVNKFSVTATNYGIVCVLRSFVKEILRR